MRNQSSSKVVIIPLGRSHDLGCVMLFGVVMSAFFGWGLLTQEADWDWIGWVAILVIFAFTTLFIYLYFFSKRQLTINEATITGPFMLEIALQDIAAIEEVSYLRNPHTIVIHGLRGRSFMTESSSATAADRLIQALLDRGLSIAKRSVPAGMSVLIGTRRGVPTMVGGAVVPVSVPDAKLPVIRAWQRTDLDVDSVTQQEQQLGYTEFSVNQTVQLILLDSGRAESADKTIAPSSTLTSFLNRIPLWLSLSLQAIVLIGGFFIATSIILTLVIYYHLPLAFGVVLWLILMVVFLKKFQRLFTLS